MDRDNSMRHGGGMKEPGAMMAEHHHMSLWVHPILMALGAWLMTSPVTFGYRSARNPEHRTFA